MRTTFLATSGAMAAITALLLTGCVQASSPAASEHSAAGASAAATPHPAYVGPTGAPVVVRPGAVPVSKRALAPVTDFTGAALWSDGVSLRASNFSRGAVTSTGPGVIDAPYVVFSLTIHNASTKKMNLSGVVVTFLTGAHPSPAAPVYDDVKVHDFAGTLAPGRSTTARYAFAIARSVTTGALYVDTDGARLAAEFSGPIPQ